MEKIKALDKRISLNSINRFAVYYGINAVNKLKEYDLVIIEPLAYNKAEIEKLRASGTIVIAYVSVMEIHKLNSLYNLLKEDDFIKVNGKYIVNEEYGTYLLNINSERWKAILMHHIGNLIMNEGYDGVFMDTIGDVEYQGIPKILQTKLISGAINFIKTLKNTFNHCIIIQNNGLENLCDYTWHLIDGVCWENPPINYKYNKKWVKAIISKLEQLQQGEEKKLLILFEENADIKKVGYDKYDKIINNLFSNLNYSCYITEKNYIKLK